MKNNNSKKCPKCQQENIKARFTCHTYFSHDAWRHCSYCDSAIEYFCLDCDWEFTHGLNEKNPRNIENMKNKPDWINGPLEYHYMKGINMGPKKIQNIEWQWEKFSRNEKEINQNEK